MEETLKKKIEGLFNQLSAEQKKEEILEIEDIPENQEIITYLEKTGTVEVTYEMDSIQRSGRIQEKGGITYLWYRKTDGTWIIKLWEINRIRD